MRCFYGRRSLGLVGVSRNAGRWLDYFFRVGLVTRVLLVLALSLVSGTCAIAQTQSGGSLITTSGNRVTVRADRVVQGAARSGALTVVTPISMPAPGGNTVAARTAVTITKHGVLSIAARALASTPAIAAVVLAVEVLDEIRIRASGDGQTLLQDVGQPPDVSGGWCFNEPGAWFHGICGQTKSEAIGNYVSIANDTHVGDISKNCGTGTGQYCVDVEFRVGTDELNCSVQTRSHTIAFGSFPGNTTNWSCRSVIPQFVGEAVDECPPWYDSWRGISVPAGSPRGADGLCPTGAYTRSLTPDEAATMREAFDNGASTVNYPALLDEALGRVPFQLPPSNVDVGNIIPSVIRGPVTTTQNADGTTTRTETEWESTPSRPGTQPNTSVIDWKKTETTTTTDTTTGEPIGQPIVKIETPGEDAATDDGPQTEDEERDPCEGKPDRLGCIDTGEVPDEDLDQDTRNVSVTPDSGWGASSASCPPPTELSVLGQRVEIDNSLICQFMQGIRPFVVGVAGIVATMLFIGGLRGAE